MFFSFLKMDLNHNVHHIDSDTVILHANFSAQFLPQKTKICAVCNLLETKGLCICLSITINYCMVYITFVPENG